jgi:hypothetical protein
MPAARIPQLKPGTRLLHVGPPNTAADVLQRTLHLNRRELEAHNLWLPCPDRDANLAARGAIGFESTDECAEAWQRLVADTALAGDRIAVISSELFAYADAEQAASLLDRLGGEDVHVVLTFRPLVKVLPSWWQDSVQLGLGVKYEQWLDQALNRDGGNPMAWQWNRQRHEELLDRWIAVAGADRVTVIAVDDGYRRQIVGAFEKLVGVAEGTLDLAPEWDRDLTAAEVEFVRLCFEEFRRKRLPRSVYQQYLLGGGIRRMREQRFPTADESAIATPIWAQERAAEIGGRLVDRIRAAGVDVIGDLEMLRGTVDERPETDLGVMSDERPEPELRMTPEAAAKAMLGVLEILIEERQSEIGEDPGSPAAVPARNEPIARD